MKLSSVFPFLTKDEIFEALLSPGESRRPEPKPMEDESFGTQGEIQWIEELAARDATVGRWYYSWKAGTVDWQTMLRRIIQELVSWRESPTYTSSPGMTITGGHGAVNPSILSYDDFLKFLKAGLGE